MIYAIWEESAEEHRVRLTLKDKQFADGDCPYECIDLTAEGLVCGCNEHELTGKRSEVVHLFGRHWNASCAFRETQEAIKELEAELQRQKGALQIILNVTSGNPPFAGM